MYLTPRPSLVRLLLVGLSLFPIGLRAGAPEVDFRRDIEPDAGAADDVTSSRFSGLAVTRAMVPSSK